MQLGIPTTKIQNVLHIRVFVFTLIHPTLKNFIVWKKISIDLKEQIVFELSENISELRLFKFLQSFVMILSTVVYFHLLVCKKIIIKNVESD